MRRMMRVVAVAAVLVAASTSGASAQRAFGMGAADIGPVIGLGGIGGAGLSFGGRFEKAIKELPNLGDGVLAIQVSADYYSFSNDANFSFRYIPIGVTANYHIKVNNEKVDPFVGAGLGYLIFSCSSCGSALKLQVSKSPDRSEPDPCWQLLRKPTHGHWAMSSLPRLPNSCAQH